MEVPRSARPTGARVREALFSMIGQDLSGERVLDAFAGAGLLGLEAWSRGADVVAVDRSRAAVGAIERNAAAMDATLDVRTGDVLLLAPRLGTFDGILADPPYALDPAAWLPQLCALTTGWLVVETSVDRQLHPPDGLSLDRRRCYGTTALWVLRRER